jgi:hypothetical protein
MPPGHSCGVIRAAPTVAVARRARIEGELDDPAGIARAVDGADAVISALGPSLRRGSTGTPITDGTQNIVSAMDTAGVRRYVGLATPSVADPRDRPTLKAKALPIVARVAFPNALTELIGMTRTVTVLLAFRGDPNATVRKLAVPDLTTTVLTLTITGVAHHSTLEWPSWAIGTWSAVAERARPS